MSKTYFLLTVFIFQFDLSSSLALDSIQNQFPHLADSLKIGQIIIVRKNVFDNDNPGQPFYYKWANKFHLVTREHIIKRELLFKKGNSFRPELIEETERNLRKLQYLAKAEIETVSNQDKLDIQVETQDLWTLSFSMSASAGGGNWSFSTSLGDNNLLGNGQTLSVLYSIDNFDRQNWGVDFIEPRIFSSRWGVHLFKSQSNQGRQNLVVLEKPLFSLDTRWSLRTAFVDVSEVVRFYQQGKEVFEYDFTEQKYEFSWVNSRGYTHKKQISAGYNFFDRRYENPRVDELSFSVPWQNLVKTNRFTIGAAIGEYIFDKQTYFDRFERIEDLTLGWWQEASLGISFDRHPNRENKFYFQYFSQYAKRLSENQYFWLRHKVESNVFAGNLDQTEALGVLTYYNKSLKSQTLALRLSGRRIKKFVPFRQLILGGYNGLRGYSAFRYSGTKQILLNLEDRIFTSLKIFTVAIGGVIFLDTGRVWEENQKMAFKDLRYDIGFGFRFGLTKAYAAKVARLDFAKALNEDSFFISFGVDQIFGWDSF